MNTYDNTMRVISERHHRWAVEHPVKRKKWHYFFHVDVPTVIVVGWVLLGNYQFQDMIGTSALWVILPLSVANYFMWQSLLAWRHKRNFDYYHAETTNMGVEHRHEGEDEHDECIIRQNIGLTVGRGRLAEHSIEWVEFRVNKTKRTVDVVATSDPKYVEVMTNAVDVR